MSIDGERFVEGSFVYADRPITYHCVVGNQHFLGQIENVLPSVRRLSVGYTYIIKYIKSDTYGDTHERKDKVVVFTTDKDVENESNIDPSMPTTMSSPSSEIYSCEVFDKINEITRSVSPPPTVTLTDQVVPSVRKRRK